MSDIQNPPAFPNVCRNDPGHPESAPGMSLRDWFASHAPPVAWSFEPLPYQDPSEITDWSAKAQNARNREEMERELAREVKWRFYWADAMLAHRQLGRASK